MNEIPPCAGKWALFDSTDLIDHIEARAICQECPIRLQCADELKSTRRAAMADKTYGPAGTWAGELVGAARITRNQQLLAARDAEWKPREVRKAHAAYNRGDRSPWATRGHRIYNRQFKAKKRAGRGVAA